MAQETRTEGDLPNGFRWKDLATKHGQEQFQFYKRLLAELGLSRRPNIRDIFADAETCLSQARHLTLLVEEFDAINWYGAREETALADLYEGLLEKNSTESKSGAGQYFTPRPLIDCIVNVMRPQPGEIIQDPACGTAGFLIAADRYIKQETRNFETLDRRDILFQQRQAFVGIELVPKTHKLALMNAMLHGIHGSIVLGDALGDAGDSLVKADLILTNPPFGTKRGAGLPSRRFPIPTSNKQLAFLQHVYLGLKPGGRAAVVMPDLQGSAARRICAELMDRCNLHTVLRLPAGIFYALGVKTNVLFFHKGKEDIGNTNSVWIYDLRTNMPRFGKRTPLTRDHFFDFEKAYGSEPDGTGERTDEGENSRFRQFTREEIHSNGENLDIVWLTEKSDFDVRIRKSPDLIVDEVAKKLRIVLKSLDSLAQEMKERN
jgi:type I restriction enzyme M protein